MFNRSLPNGGVFPRPGIVFRGDPFTRLLPDLNADGQPEQLNIVDLIFEAIGIVDTQRVGNSVFHDVEQTARFSGRINPDFGPIILTGGVSAFRQDIEFPGEAVTEPTSLLLIGAGVAGLGALAWRRSRRA